MVVGGQDCCCCRVAVAVEVEVECRGIQKRLRETNKSQDPEHVAKVFAKLMIKGKVHAALKMLEKEASLGIAEVNKHTLAELRKPHPKAEPIDESALISGEELPHFDPIVFDNIDETSIGKAALKPKEQQVLLVRMQMGGDEFLSRKITGKLVKTCAQPSRKCLEASVARK